MTEVRFVVSQNLVKDVFNVNSPHGPMIVWESLYPEDKGKPCRFFVTIDERLRSSTEDAFAHDGFFFSHGFTKAECVNEVKKMQKLSMATMDTQCTLRGHVDSTLKNLRIRQWKNAVEKYMRKELEKV